MQRLRYPHYRSSSHHQHLPSIRVVLEGDAALTLSSLKEGYSRVLLWMDHWNHLNTADSIPPTGATSTTTTNLYPYAPSNACHSNRIDHAMKTLDYRYSDPHDEKIDDHNCLDEDDDSRTIFEEKLEECQRPDSPTPTLRGHIEYSPRKGPFNVKLSETSKQNFVSLANALKKVLTSSRKAQAMT